MSILLALLPWLIFGLKVALGTASVGLSSFGLALVFRIVKRNLPIAGLPLLRPCDQNEVWA